MKIVSSELSNQLLEHNGWSPEYARGHLDGETFRRLDKTLPPHARVGIDQYSLGFRAGYFERQNARVGRPATAAAAGTGHAGAPLPPVPPTVDRNVRSPVL